MPKSRRGSSLRAFQVSFLFSMKRSRFVPVKQKCPREQNVSCACLQEQTLLQTGVCPPSPPPKPSESPQRNNAEHVGHGQQGHGKQHPWERRGSSTLCTEFHPQVQVLCIFMDFYRFWQHQSASESLGI